VKSHIPGLAQMAEGIGDPQVRHRGTLGGSTAHADPAADYPAGLIGLNATIKTNQRSIAAEDFFQGMFTTALEPEELITSVRFAKPQKSAYAKFANPASKYAIVGVFVAQFADHVRVAVTGAAPSYMRIDAMEKALSSQFSADAIDQIEVSADGMSDDPDANAAYRAHLITVMAKRAVKAAA
ncbi:MAG: FAD binding domain-containing protein, partial [Myxococcota bacterium]